MSGLDFPPHNQEYKLWDLPQAWKLTLLADPVVCVQNLTVLSEELPAV